MGSQQASEHAEPATESEHLLQQIARAYYDLLAAFEQQMGISATRARVLMQLAQEAELSQAELQRRMRVDGAVITRQVKQCEEEGLLLRRTAPHDNRYTLVALTAEGRKLTEQLLVRRDHFAAQLVGGIGDGDLVIMQRCLRQIRANAAAISTPAADAPDLSDHT